ncbi:hypothetical protein BD560DRAFT_161092 [Blakeslea trispora]|nr:hypothetical protein BD560DRAFT_161092 [Blakeslea trispora]
MAIGIGWFLDDDHDFDTLMVTILIGSVILFLLCLSTSVQPTDPTLLGITPPDIDEQSPLVKPTDLVDTSSLPYYKPYSLFREHLSHISEEDASLLQHMTTTNNSIATKLLRRPMSVCSEFSCMSYATIPNNMMRSQSAIIQPYPIHHESEHDQPKSLQAIQSSMHQLLNDQIPPSFELARLPYPPPQAPAIVLITFIPGYNKRQGPLPQQENPSRCHIPSHHHYQSKWILRSFASSIFCLGIVFGMTQPLLYLHLHDTLGFPMHTIGLIGFLTILADYLARHLVLKVIQYCHLPTIIVGAHITLTLCTFSYTQLQPGGCLSTQVWASVLQSLFGKLDTNLKFSLSLSLFFLFT